MEQLENCCNRLFVSKYNNSKQKPKNHTNSNCHIDEISKQSLKKEMYKHTNYSLRILTLISVIISLLAASSALGARRHTSAAATTSSQNSLSSSLDDSATLDARFGGDIPRLVALPSSLAAVAASISPTSSPSSSTSSTSSITSTTSTTTSLTRSSRDTSLAPTLGNSLANNNNDIGTCGYPGSPAHATVSFSALPVAAGVAASYACDNGYELLGPPRRICQANGTWAPIGIPFCVLNVGLGKAAMQSSTAGHGSAQKAVDGSTSQFFQPSTCTMTDAETNPWWYVNLLEPYLVQIVRIDFGMACCGNRQKATLEVRVGNNRPDLGTNPVCNKYTGFIEEGKPLFLPCTRPSPGAFVSIHLESTNGIGSPLSICETFVYTDHALSIEQCPSFRDQPLGSTATYNGKCYLFHSNKQLPFDAARKHCEARGGSLVDETSPALQGFLSWELYRRHRNDQLLGQYWLGAVRDPRNPANWKWLNGNKDVQISFWHSLSANGNCSRFDGSKGWLWSDSDCSHNLNFICQYRPLSCGKPERPTNSTLIAKNLDSGTVIEYQCAHGSVLLGPKSRTCLPSGFFSEFAPKCRYVDCQPPASVSNGSYKLLNSTTSYKSLVRYSCASGYAIVGRSTLACDVDERWNGPPPRCEPTLCSAPIPPSNGYVTVTSNVTLAGTQATFDCRLGYELIGDKLLTCMPSGSWNANFPFCRVDKRQPLGDASLATNNAPRQRPASSTATRQQPTFSPNRLSATSSSTTSTSASTSTSTPTSTTPAPNTLLNEVLNPSHVWPASLNGLGGQTQAPPTSQTPVITSQTSTGQNSVIFGTDPSSQTPIVIKSTYDSVAQSSSVPHMVEPPTIAASSSLPSSSVSASSFAENTIQTSLAPQQSTATVFTNNQQTQPLFVNRQNTNNKLGASVPSQTQTSSVGVDYVSGSSMITPGSHMANTPATVVQSSIAPSSSSLSPTTTTTTSGHQHIGSHVPNVLTPSASSSSNAHYSQSHTSTNNHNHHHHHNNANSLSNAKNIVDKIVAIGVFGVFLFFGVIISIIVIIIRRQKSHSSSIDAQTISTYESHAEHNGLYRNYQHAWDNLRYGGSGVLKAANNSGACGGNATLGDNPAAGLALGGAKQMASVGATGMGGASGAAYSAAAAAAAAHHAAAVAMATAAANAGVGEHNLAMSASSDASSACDDDRNHSGVMRPQHHHHSHNHNLTHHHYQHHDEDIEDETEDEIDENEDEDESASSPENQRHNNHRNLRLTSNNNSNRGHSGERETDEMTVRASTAANGSAKQQKPSHHYSTNSIGRSMLNGSQQAARRRSMNLSAQHYEDASAGNLHYHQQLENYQHHGNRALSHHQLSSAPIHDKPTHSRSASSYRFVQQSSNSPGSNSTQSSDDLEQLAYGSKWNLTPSAATGGVGGANRRDSGASEHDSSSSNGPSAGSGASILRGNGGSRSNLRYGH